jgi:isoprenylcysteine carboxyl methyltransferase (ICMT) family protein YpbQ
MNKKASNVEGQMERPDSATHGLVAGAGIGAFIMALILIRLHAPFGDDEVLGGLFVMGATATAIFLPDLLWRKVHRRKSTGLDFTYDDPSWGRTLTKLIGFAATLGFIAFLYWLFPEYHGQFYQRYYRTLMILGPPCLVGAVPYFHWVDRRMPDPRDGYWHMGKAVAGQWGDVSGNIVVQHMFGWVVKGFFLPLMLVWFYDYINRLQSFDLGTLGGFMPCYDFLLSSIYMVDCGLAGMGYILTLRITDSHLRSTEPTMLGWASALICYPPFSRIMSWYLAYETGINWSAWLMSRPSLLVLWGSAILVLTGIYLWATVMFGARFSNLTHRGILTNGPYRFTKHPHYVTKNLSWWLISVPFMGSMNPADTIRHCLLLVGVNLVYYLRAKTEEWHLSSDPDYVAYSRWIDSHGIFRFLSI